MQISIEIFIQRAQLNFGVDFLDQDAHLIRADDEFLIEKQRRLGHTGRLLKEPYKKE